MGHNPANVMHAISLGQPYASAVASGYIKHAVIRQFIPEQCRTNLAIQASGRRMHSLLHPSDRARFNRMNLAHESMLNRLIGVVDVVSVVPYDQLVKSDEVTVIAGGNSSWLVHFGNARLASNETLPNINGTIGAFPVTDFVWNDEMRRFAIPQNGMQYARQPDPFNAGTIVGRPEFIASLQYTKHNFKGEEMFYPWVPLPKKQATIAACKLCQQPLEMMVNRQHQQYHEVCWEAANILYKFEKRWVYLAVRQNFTCAHCKIPLPSMGGVLVNLSGEKTSPTYGWPALQVLCCDICASHMMSKKMPEMALNKESAGGIQLSLF